MPIAVDVNAAGNFPNLVRPAPFVFDCQPEALSAFGNQLLQRHETNLLHQMRAKYDKSRGTGNPHAHRLEYEPCRIFRRTKPPSIAAEPKSAGQRPYTRRTTTLRSDGSR